MKKLTLLMMVGLMSLAVYGQKVEIGTGVSNNGGYLVEINILDSVQSFSRRGDWTITKGLNPMIYGSNSYISTPTYNQELLVPAVNNYYLGTFMRLEKKSSKIFSTDLGFGVGIARNYSLQSRYDSMSYLYFIKDNGMKTSIGMTVGINLQVMSRLSTYFKFGGLFNDNKGFAAVGFRYCLPIKNTNK
jgi:hypothetical protein